MEKVQSGKFVQVHYTGKLEDGTLFDSSDGREPLEFQVGSGQIIPGFETAITGMALNEEKDFRLEAAEAYGAVRDDLKKEFPLADLGSEKVTVGQELWFKSPQGPIPGKVLAMEGENFTVDFNHPLAGKDLNFSIKLVGISDAPTQAPASSCSCSSAGGGGSCSH